MTVGLLRIETRRSAALWLAPVMAAIAWWFIARPQLASATQFWPDRSVQVLHVVGQIGPLIAGAAAWMAGRNRRRGMEDLLATSPYPSWMREIVTCAAVAAWGLLVYVLIGGYIITGTALQNAWGEPGMGPIVVGLLAVPAQAAIGYAIGYHLPSRFTAPLIAVALFIVENVAGAQGPLEWYNFLSPGITSNTGVLFGTVPDLSGLQALYLLGLTGIALGSLALRGHDTLTSRGVLLAAIVLTAVSVSLIKTNGNGGPYSRSGVTPQQFASQLIPFTPVCSRAAVSVCVHPTVRAHLPTMMSVINRVAMPVVGVPDGPTRVVDGNLVWISPPVEKFGQDAIDSRLTTRLRKKGMFVYSTLPSRVITLAVDSLSDLGPTLASQVAGSIVSGIGAPVESCFPDGCGGPSGAAQEAIAVWLVQRAGFDVQWSELNGAHSSTPEATVVAAAHRFAALSPRQQHAWLRMHFAALRDGQVGLKDVP